MADPLYVAHRNTSNQLSLNISDVIDVIGEDDPEYAATVCGSVYAGVRMSESSEGPSEVSYSTISASSRLDVDLESKRRAYVRILEQPQPKALRFRYICEGRSAGSIPGVHSTPENKTHPTIQVIGYTGPAVVVVSCVTVDPPYRPHPHNLVGKDGCKKGVCTVNFNSDKMQCVFSNLGIQCVKKKEVEEALSQRESIRVDPFQTGYEHKKQPQIIDLNSLRFCFQVFLEGAEKGKFSFPLKPVVSEPIYDKKATSDLVICKLSDCSCTVAGGKEMILLCDKVAKEDIQVRFYEIKEGLIEWEGFGEFQASDVHKQVAIAFKAPKYHNLEIENPVKVYIQLVRPSDKSTSDPRPFQYLPLDTDPQYLKRKITKLGNSENVEKINRFLAENAAVYGENSRRSPGEGNGMVARPVRVPSRPSRQTDKIKMEPPGSPLSVSPGDQISPELVGAMMGGNLLVKTPSPQHYGGGTVYAMTPPSHSPGYYVQHSPNGGGGVTVTLPHGMSFVAPSYYLGATGGPQFSSGAPVAVEAHNYAPAAGAAAAGMPMSQLLDLDSHKYVEQHCLELDISNINSAELRSLLPSGDVEFNSSMVDAHLSENLSSCLNIIDTPPAQTTNRLGGARGGPNPSIFTHNIPPVSVSMKSESSNSNSLNLLKSELEYLNRA